MQRSFFKDIASDTRLGPAASSALLAQSLDTSEKLFAQRTALQQASSDLRSRQLAYDSTKFTLDEAREKAARERNAFGDVSKALADINPIIQDTNGDRNQRTQALGLQYMRYAPLIAISPAIANVFHGANLALSQEKEKPFTKEDYFKHGGTLSVMDAHEKEVGALKNNAEVPIDLLGRSNELVLSNKQTAAEDKAQAAADLAERKAKIQEENKNYHDLLTDVNKIDLKKDFEGKLPNAWNKAADKEFADAIIGRSATPEEEKEYNAPDATVATKLGIAQKIASSILAGSRPKEKPQLKPSATRNLFR